MEELESRRHEELTELLEIGSVEGSSHERLWALVYDELRVVARRQLRKGGDSLQTTALVHETYLRLAADSRVSSRGRGYFFGAAARAMRQILVDHARRRSRVKRGAGAQAVTLKTGDAEVDGFASDVLDLNRALERLEALSPRQVQVVECRYFAGLSVEQTAETLEISPRTVKRDWGLARAWLYRELDSASQPG